MIKLPLLFDFFYVDLLVWWWYWLNYWLIPLVGSPDMDPLAVKLLDNRLYVLNHKAKYGFLFTQSYGQIFVPMFFIYLVLCIHSSESAWIKIFLICNHFQNTLQKFKLYLLKGILSKYFDNLAIIDNIGSHLILSLWHYNCQFAEKENSSK